MCGLICIVFPGIYCFELIIIHETPLISHVMKTQLRPCNYLLNNYDARTHNETNHLFAEDTLILYQLSIKHLTKFPCLIELID